MMGVILIIAVHVLLYGLGSFLGFIILRSIEVFRSRRTAARRFNDYWSSR